jgi:hypothetical protein
MSEYNFGEVILQALQNEDRLRLQREQLGDERAFRTATLANDAKRIRQSDEQQRIQQEQFQVTLDEALRKDPTVTVGDIVMPKYQSEFSNEFLRSKLPFSQATKAMDDILKSRQIDVSDALLKEREAYAKAVLTQKTTEDARMKAASKFAQDYFKYSQGSAIRSEDLQAPQSPFSMGLGNIFTANQGGLRPSLGDMFQFVTAGIFSPDVKRAQLSNRKKVEGSIPYILRGAEFALAGVKGEVLDEVTGEPLPTNISMAEVGASAERSLTELSNLLSLEDQGLIKLGDEEREKVLQHGIDLASALQYDTSRLNRAIRERVQAASQINRNKVMDTIFQNEQEKEN